MYKGIIFDFGNTLTRSSSLADSLEQILDNPNSKAIGLSIENKIYKLYKPDQVEQPSWISVWKESFDEFGTPFTESIGREHLKTFTKNCKTQTYSIPLLTKLKNIGLKIALLSNVTGDAEIFQNDLQNRGLDKFFDVIAWSSDIGFRKPSIQSYNYVIDKLNLNKSEIIMIGDSEIADIRGAIKAGLNCIKITDEENNISDATYVVKRESAFEDIISITTGESYIN
ncbi:HAD family hydrolase [Spirochaeta isovalerica]|uniref:HAD superfamily hydrolase (TIGR01662 family) n=1 Tax=Spirochaeta isovalerica TaxID=150 RepID=A0A841RKC7_9SPIO|nr:HAD-IA family hydrolase [Spirochaeta isovalerica]MBB6482722.1 HAD superfamily hydrolase (TIGR01662 family) [Spirochaeta isovalerica]